MTQTPTGMQYCIKPDLFMLYDRQTISIYYSSDGEHYSYLELMLVIIVNRNLIQKSTWYRYIFSKLFLF